MKPEEEAVLTPPLSLDGGESHTTPTLIQRILSLLASFRHGSDLARLQASLLSRNLQLQDSSSNNVVGFESMQLPPQFNIPKSQLQCYGESVYSIATNLLSKCATEETPVDRIAAVVAWNISTFRPLPFGVAPYNPVLGETHHVSAGSLNVMVEQVSHHPPVAALQATDEKDNIEIIWCQCPMPRFYGSHIETEVQGKRQVKVVDKKETYTMNAPNLVIRFLPLPSVEWLGTMRVRCEETDLEAEVNYRGSSFWPRPSMHRSIKGKIVRSSTSETICEISGHWDRSVMVKEVSTGKTRTIYNAKEALVGLKTPVVKDPKGVSGSESSVVWREVSLGILEKRWEKAREGKSRVEERQRERARERELKGEEWDPKHFNVVYSKESGWDCIPKNKVLPLASIVV